jgi:dinuclear metal center YbgI/SA1388 family protein
MQLAELIRTLEAWAPPALQESYDNSGLITGHPQQEITAVLVSLDVTEAILDEAIEQGCNVIVSHHPIVFSGLKKLTGKTAVERIVVKAIRHGIALYAIHTNLDNVAHGVNSTIAGFLRP